MNILRIHVDRESITALPERPLVAGSVGVVRFTADFDESWDNYSKTVIFAAIRYDSAVSRMVLYTGGEMEVPWEVLAEPGFLKISALGSGQGRRQPTARMGEGLVILPSGELSGGDPEQNTPELWEQAMETAAEAARTAQAVQEQVDRVNQAGEAAAAAAESAEAAAVRAQAAAEALENAVIQAGAVRQVAGVGPDGSGNVPLTAADVGALSGTDGALETTGMAADAAAVGARLGEKLSTAGGDMTGVLTVLAPVSDTNPATKKYVDDEVQAAKDYAGAKYSPMIYPNESRALTMEDLGKTLLTNNANEDFVFTIDDALHAAAPLGFECAITFWTARSAAVQVTADAYLAAAGAGVSKNRTVQIAEKYAMVAVKKMTAGAWLITGSVEV